MFESAHIPTVGLGMAGICLIKLGSFMIFFLISERPNRAGSAEPSANLGQTGSAEPSVILAEPPSLKKWRFFC